MISVWERIKLSPNIIQNVNTMIDISIIVGTNIPDTLSAIDDILALLLLASSTKAMIWLMVVSSPTFVALHMIEPLIFVVPLFISSPIFLSTGILSPVNELSSTLVMPSIISPSTGII